MTLIYKQYIHFFDYFIHTKLSHLILNIILIENMNFNNNNTVFLYYTGRRRKYSEYHLGSFRTFTIRVNWNRNRFIHHTTLFDSFGYHFSDRDVNCK